MTLERVNPSHIPDVLILQHSYTKLTKSYEDYKVRY
jgi:hypothetical protein